MLRRLFTAVLFWAVTIPAFAQPLAFRRVGDATPRDLYDSLPAAIAPNGRHALYSRWSAGARDLWVVDTETGRRRQLLPAQGSRAHFDWSANSRQIAYVDLSPERSGLWVVDVAAARELRIYQPAGGQALFPRWLDMERLLLIVRTGNGDVMRTVRSNGSDPQTVSDRVGRYQWATLSPNQQQLVVLTRADDRPDQVWLARPGGELVRPLTSDLVFSPQAKPIWNASGTRVFITGARGADPALHLWELSLDGADPRRIDALTGEVQQATLLADGKLGLATTESRTTIATLPAAGGVPMPVLPASAPTAAMPSWTRDGRSLAYITGNWWRLTMPDNWDVGMVPLDRHHRAAGPPLPLVAFPGVEDYAAAWSPDGRWLAFHSHLGGTDDVYLRAADDASAPVRRLSGFGPGSDAGAPAWSPDGRHLVVTAAPASSSDEHGAPGPDHAAAVSRLFILEIDPATGASAAPVRVLPLEGFEGTAMDARYSPDGAQIAFSGMRPGAQAGVYVVPAAGGPVRTVVEFDSGESYGWPEWSRDGKTLYYAADHSGRYRIYQVDIESGRTRAITRGHQAAVHPQLSPDGRTLAVTAFDVRAVFWRQR